jgi:hypothetical protein
VRVGWECRIPEEEEGAAFGVRDEFDIVVVADRFDIRLAAHARQPPNFLEHSRGVVLKFGQKSPKMHRKCNEKSMKTGKNWPKNAQCPRALKTSAETRMKKRGKKIRSETMRRRKECDRMREEFNLKCIIPQPRRHLSKFILLNISVTVRKKICAACSGLSVGDK